MPETIHNGFINKKLTNSLKDTGLNNFDLATTRIYKGVKPMWEQLGFENDDSDIPNQNIYWNNIIPDDFNFSNISNVNIEGDIMIDEDNQFWDDEYYYPILPTINKFGVFDDDVDVELYGGVDAPITNLNVVDENLILDVDFNQTTTDDLIDKTDFNKVDYNQDFQVSLDKNLRIKIDTFIIPEGIEKDNLEQAF